MFNQVDVSLIGTLISSSTNTYLYRCMLETLLSYGKGAKKSQLCAELLYKDQAGNMDEVVIQVADGYLPNEGLQNRRALISKSRDFDMIGHIHGDIFSQEKYLLIEVGMMIKPIRSNDNFNLMGAADAKHVVAHALLFVCKVKLSLSVFLGHAKALQSSTAKYPIKRVVCKSFQTPEYCLDASHEKLFSGQLPTRIVIGLVNNRSFNGSRDHNPFSFHHCNVSEITLGSGD